MSGIPQFTVPPIDSKTGQWNREWWLFFQNVWKKTGGESDLTDSDANSLTRNRDSKSNSSTSVIEREIAINQRQSNSKKIDESVPVRHPTPKLIVSKETYKPFTLIRIYRGLIADLPTGWVLADGSGGAPDLRDKFIVGSGNLYPLNSNGGSTTININNIPAHTHPYIDTNYTANTVVVQSGTGTTVVQSLSSNPVSSNTGSNSTTATAYLPPYYAMAYITNAQTVNIVTDVKLR